MDFEFLILGGGVAGLATAWHLVRAGAAPEQVGLIEAERGFGSQASAQNAGILRTFSGDPVLDEIGRRSAAFLAQPPPGFAARPLVDPVGFLLLASGDEARRLRAAVRAQERDGMDPGARELSEDELTELAPHLAETARDVDLCLHFPREGRLDVVAQIDAFVRGVRERGVTLRTSLRVEQLVVVRGRVIGVVCQDGVVVRARQTILAAGAWAGRLGAGAGSAVALQPTRRHLAVTQPEAGVNERWPVVWCEDDSFYARPEAGGMLLCACDNDEVDPDSATEDPDVLRRVQAKTRHNLACLGSAAEAPIARFWHGLRTQTADGRFCVGPDPDLAGLFWVAGLGGHGMTAGAEVGRLAADLLLSRVRSQDRALLQALEPHRLLGNPEAPQARSQDHAPVSRQVRS